MLRKILIADAVVILIAFTVVYSPDRMLLPGFAARAADDKSGSANGVVMFGGDVHHCFVSKVNLPSDVGTVHSKVWHAVCSGLRKELELKERLVLGFGHTWIAAKIGRMLAASASVRPPRLTWEMTTRPRFRNQIGTLEIAGGEVGIRIEQATGNWTNPQLRTVIEEKLL